MTKDEIEELKRTRWKHHNGNIYTICFFTNLPDDVHYPLTVIYQGENGNMWSRPWNDWHRSMTKI